MNIAKSKIKKILVISLSNIGDVVLTFPVIDILHRDFPKAKLSVVVGPKAESLFKGNPYIHRVILYYKKQSLLQVIAWLFKLRKDNYDLVVDLRNTIIPFLVSTHYLTPPFSPRNARDHMRRQHLRRLKVIYPYKEESKERFALHIPPQERLSATNMICNEIGDRKPYVVIAPGAADSSKRWKEEQFGRLADELIKRFAVQIAFIGDKNDHALADAICQRMGQRAVNFCGRISLIHSAVVLERSCAALVNDSAPMHLASYLDVPTVALFGPSDPRLYGPWSESCHVIEHKSSCPACKDPHSKGPHSCMDAISVEEVLNVFEITSSGDVILKKQI
ncbi:MAG: glycosyltransferase family 9 protein [Candidatus Omnitrophota bacterium]|jgi:ADP-heptose:LPS heptosyltransferase